MHGISAPLTPAQLFEKLYLSPQNQVKGELRKTFANPTPIALIGYIIALVPLSCDLMVRKPCNTIAALVSDSLRRASVVQVEEYQPEPPAWDPTGSLEER